MTTWLTKPNIAKVSHYEEMIKPSRCRNPKARVRNLRPAGHMRPAKVVCATHGDLYVKKNAKNQKLLS